MLHRATTARCSAWRRAADGAIYAGTGPNGRVVRIDRGQGQGRSRRPGLLRLVAGGRPEGRGRLRRHRAEGAHLPLTPDGKASVFYATTQEHILCLAVAADGTLYAGTDKDGLVYRIDAKGKGFVLYQAAQAEMRSLQVSGDCRLRRHSSRRLAARGAGAVPPAAGEDFGHGRVEASPPCPGLDQEARAG